MSDYELKLAQKDENGYTDVFQMKGNAVAIKSALMFIKEQLDKEPNQAPKEAK